MHLRKKSQKKKLQNTKYMTMYDKIKSVRISKYDTAEKVKCQYRFLYNQSSSRGLAPPERSSTPRQSWLRTVEADLKPLNFGLHTACRRAADRSTWRSIVETAMLFDGRATP